MIETDAKRTFQLILILFVAGRLMMLAAFTPEAIATYGDFEHYFNLARLSDQNIFPLLDYWYEFPPLFPLLSLGLYQLVASSTGALHSYIYALAVVMLAFDAGCLFLLFRLSHLLWGKRTALQTSWVYLALPVALVYTWRTFDSMTAFWILLAFYWLLMSADNPSIDQRRFYLSAVALGLGVMTKYVPIILLPAVWLLWPVGRALKYTAVVVLVVILIFGPVLVSSPDFGIASLQAQASKSSWQTVWALIDGNYGTGNFGPIAEHFDPALATKLQGEPERIPGWLTLVPFAAVGFLFFLRTRRKHVGPVNLTAFVTLTFALFLLWSKGWSPQWQMMLLPFVLLAFPSRNGILFCVLFGLICFVEWPVLISRGMTDLLWTTIIARTLLLLGLAAASAQLVLMGSGTQDAGDTSKKLD